MYAKHSNQKHGSLSSFHVYLLPPCFFVMTLCFRGKWHIAIKTRATVGSSCKVPAPSIFTRSSRSGNVALDVWTFYKSSETWLNGKRMGWNNNTIWATLIQEMREDDRPSRRKLSGSWCCGWGQAPGWGKGREGFVAQDQQSHTQ